MRVLERASLAQPASQPKIQANIANVRTLSIRCAGRITQTYLEDHRPDAVCDTSHPSSIKALLKKTVDSLGVVHCINNGSVDPIRGPREARKLRVKVLQLLERPADHVHVCVFVVCEQSRSEGSTDVLGTGTEDHKDI